MNYIGCPKSLEPMGILITFPIFIYRLRLNVKNGINIGRKGGDFRGFLKAQVYAVKI
jgi:hypothetical protein